MVSLVSDYTPTTSQIIEAFAWDDTYDELSIERIDMFWRWLSKIKEEVSTKAHFEHWLAEVKAEAWEEGTLACLDTHHLPVEDSKLPRNPYRQGETE